VQDSVASHENDKAELQAKFQEEKSQLQREKEKLLAERAMVKEAVSKACHFVPGLAQEEQELVEAQVVKLVETLQQLQARITELEAQTVLSTPQEVRDQREETAKNTVVRIRSLASECKQLSDRSAQTYERLVEDPELRKLEVQLQEAQQQAFSVQA
jgi:hypothetical protein